MKMAELAKDCEGTKKECRAEARAAMEAEFGEKPRKYAVLKKVGLVKDLAEAMAACLEDGAAAATCKSEAETEFMSVTGRTADAFAELVEKVETLSTAIQNGQLTELVPQMFIDVELGTSGSACVLAIRQSITAKLDEFGNVTELPCALTDALPFYRLIVTPDAANDAEVQAEAEDLATSLDGADVGRRLGQNLGRRLAESVSEVNSAQGVEEQVITDAPSPAPTPDNGSPTPANAPTPPTPEQTPASHAPRCGIFGLTFLAMVAIYVM